MAEQDIPRDKAGDPARKAAQQRRAAALRANLKRRKAQARGRGDQTAPEPAPEPGDAAD